MANPVEKCCATCRHARFELTRTGRVKSKQSGRCGFDVAGLPLPAVPDAYEIKINFIQAIWPQDGSTCPCHEAKDKP